MARMHQPGCPCCGCNPISQTEFGDEYWYYYGQYYYGQDLSFTVPAGATGRWLSDDERAAQSVKYYLTGDITRADFIVRYLDDNNYAFARIEGYSSAEDVEICCDQTQDVYAVFTAQLWEIVDGAASSLTDPLYFSPSAGTFVSYPIRVCSSASRFQLDVAETADERIILIDGTLTDPDSLGEQHGIEITAGDDEGGVTQVDVTNHSEECEDCDCEACEIGTTPKQLQITFSGIQNCSGLNGVPLKLNRSASTFCIEVGGGALDVCTDIPVERQEWGSICKWQGNPDSYYGSHTTGDVYAVVVNATVEAGVAWAQLKIYGTRNILDGTWLDIVTSNQTLGNSPVDCADVLDGLVFSPMIHATNLPFAGSMGCYFYDIANITAADTGADTLTIDEDWTYIAAGTTIGVVGTGGYREYTVASATGNPSVIAINEEVQGDEVGGVMAWSASATIAVIS